MNPHQVAQLVGASSRAPKGCGLGSGSGHITRLWVQPLVRACGGGNQSIFLSHGDVPLSLPLLLSPKSINISSGKDFFFKGHEEKEKRVNL